VGCLSLCRPILRHPAGHWPCFDTMKKMELVKTILRWTPALAWMACIFALSSRSDLPKATDSAIQELLLTTGHFVGYGVLAILLAHALALPRHGKVVACVLAVLYGLSDEFHQSFTPGRSASAADLLVDLLGALCGLYLVRPNPFTAKTTRSSRDHHGPAGDAPSS
jgi:VanZ family protein